jgi:hypothetical protein
LKAGLRIELDTKDAAESHLRQGEGVRGP